MCISNYIESMKETISIRVFQVIARECTYLLNPFGDESGVIKISSFVTRFDFSIIVTRFDMPRTHNHDATNSDGKSIAGLKEGKFIKHCSRRQP